MSLPIKGLPSYSAVLCDSQHIGTGMGEGSPLSVGDRARDGTLCASDHPGPGTDRRDPLGLIRFTDAEQGRHRFTGRVNRTLTPWPDPAPARSGPHRVVVALTASGDPGMLYSGLLGESGEERLVPIIGVTDTAPVGPGDEWPAFCEQLLAVDILVLSTSI